MINAAGFASAKRLKNRTVGFGVMRAIGMRVVNQRMHVATEGLLDGKPKHRGTGTIDEGAVARQVGTEHAVAS